MATTTLTLTLTLRAARLITNKKEGLNFITCHTFLGVFEGQKDFSKQQVLKIAAQYEYIVIDEIGLMNRSLYDIFYYMKLNSKVTIEDKQFQRKHVNYFNSLVMKELTDYNSERLLVNHRSCHKMWELYGRIEELEPCDFGNDFTRIHLCWSNKMRRLTDKEKVQVYKKLSTWFKKQTVKADSDIVNIVNGSFSSTTLYNLYGSEAVKKTKIPATQEEDSDDDALPSHSRAESAQSIDVQSAKIPMTMKRVKRNQNPFISQQRRYRTFKIQG